MREKGREEVREGGSKGGREGKGNTGRGRERSVWGRKKRKGGETCV